MEDLKKIIFVLVGYILGCTSTYFYFTKNPQVAKQDESVAKSSNLAQPLQVEKQTVIVPAVQKPQQAEKQAEPVSESHSIKIISCKDLIMDAQTQFVISSDKCKQTVYFNNISKTRSQNKSLSEIDGKEVERTIEECLKYIGLIELKNKENIEKENERYRFAREIRQLPVVKSCTTVEK